MKLEEQISTLIHAQCVPVIIPDISFHAIDGARFIKVQIYRGSNLPYYLKSKGKKEGTYIRVGSSNRQADAEIIISLERQRRNISFDSEPIHDKDFMEFDLRSFKTFFREKTGEILDEVAIKKLELLREFQGKLLPTYAYALFSDGIARKELFPYAKIECARFKGIIAGEFIDQKTIDDNISVQAEIAYDFILRHINKSASVKGVYTESRWEYPIIAIREAIRNAVVHRDYSLSGKDIKVAVYDDMVEITSPGKLMPSIDFSDMEARQSDIRNKIIAPIFKKLGVIDQWGNGLKLIADELKEYPEIEFKWFEKGLQFQLQFIRKNYRPVKAVVEDLPAIGQQIGTRLGLSWDQVGTRPTPGQHQVGTKSAPSWYQVQILLKRAENQTGIKELMEELEWKDRTKFRKKYVTPLIEEKLLAMTNPDKPTSSKQEYYLTPKGKDFLTYLNNLTA